jgi:hypothetical protein
MAQTEVSMLGKTFSNFFSDPNEASVTSLKSGRVRVNGGAEVPATGKEPDVVHGFPFSVIVAMGCLLGWSCLRNPWITALIPSYRRATPHVNRADETVDTGRDPGQSMTESLEEESPQIEETRHAPSS